MATSNPCLPGHPAAPTSSSFRDRFLAALRPLTLDPPNAAILQSLPNQVRDDELLLDCLAWLQARGDCFVSADLLASQVLYLCLQQTWPSEFLCQYRRRQK